MKSNLILSIIIILIIICIANIILVWYDNKYYDIDETEVIKSSFDGLNYKVHLKHNNAEDAAKTMSELNHRAIELMRFLRDKYFIPENANAFPSRKKATERLLDLYNFNNLTENSPKNSEDDTSYTIDKGKILALCIRHKDSMKLIDDINTLTFVLFHELSHIAIKDINHPQRFWRAFKFILEDATEANLIENVNYAINPVMYCGMKIDYNPLYDWQLPSLV